MEENEKKNRNIKSNEILIRLISITVKSNNNHLYVPEFTYKSTLVPMIGDTIGTPNYKTFKVMDRFILTSKPNEIHIYVKSLTHE